MKPEPYVLSAAAFSPDGDAWGVIQEALEAHTAVTVPYVDFPLGLSRPIALPGGRTLRVDPRTVLTDLPGCGGCLLRNAHVVCGNGAPETETGSRDGDMLVEGGIWTAPTPTVCRNDPDPVMGELTTRGLLLGVLFFSGAERFAVRNLTVRDSRNYAVLLHCVADFTVSGLVFDRQKKDGVHVNGPARNGAIRELQGNCGDDIVALNAWDWHSSAVSFGPIDSVTVEDVRAEHDEIRLLPGKKRYESGKERDCPVTRCVFRRISGVYSFKLYQQPYCYNHTRGLDDRSVTAGLLRDITFEDIRVAGDTGEGFAEVKLAAVWELGADVEHLTLRNIAVDAPAETFRVGGMSLAALGPKSSTWTRGETDPDQWEELFEPDLICHGTDITLECVTFAGERITEPALLLRCVRLTPNPAYPRTTPRGGTGYGIVKELCIR